jgi:hypothetical protein
MKIYPKIDVDLLEELDCVWSTPAKVMGKHTPHIYDAVAAMRAALEFGEGEGDAWRRLRTCMDHAATDGEWAALDDFAAAWQKPGLQKHSMRLGGKVTVSASWKSEPMRRRTLEVIEAIRDLQDTLGGAPTREEIRRKVGCPMTSLTPILKKLGILKSIPLR